MNKIIFAIMMVMLFAIPCMMNAAQTSYSLPDGAIGISEATYRELKQTTCTGYEDTNLGSQYTCPALAASLIDKIVIRSEHNGEIYQVVQLPDPSGDYANIVLKRYLPDGFYKANKKLYWISNNVKLKLEKESAYSMIVSAVKCEDLYCMAYTGISEEDWGDMATNEDLRWQLRGKVLMRTEANGALYYVSNKKVNALSKLGETVNGKSLYKFLKRQAFSVKKNLIKQISII